MAKKTCKLYVEVDYDDSKTDPESLATALDNLLTTATSTAGILSDYGEPVIGTCYVLGFAATSWLPEDIVEKTNLTEEEAYAFLVKHEKEIRSSVTQVANESVWPGLLDVYGVELSNEDEDDDEEDEEEEDEKPVTPTVNCKHCKGLIMQLGSMKLWTHVDALGNPTRKKRHHPEPPDERK